jgi:glycosyltransferase involved in cell wall biosynthesis
MKSVAIVIPTYNEALSLPDLLGDLADQRGIGLQVIVSDGGSTDLTCEVASGRSTVIQNHRPCRAEQLNLGAGHAKEEWILFLHADSRLGDPYLIKNALDRIEAMGESTAGHFPIEFVGPESDHPGFRFLSAKSKLNRPFTINGDQGFLVHRKLYDAVGGFDASLPFLEDQRFAQRVRLFGEWVTLPGYLQTSTRRFATEGFGRRYLVMAIVTAVNEIGLDDFFELVNAYAPDPHEPLDLGPIIAAIRHLTIHDGPDEALQHWSEVGHFLRLNAWQLALLLDVYLLQDRPVSLTDQFDRHIAATLNNRWADALASALAASFFLVVVPTWWSTRERAIFRRR